eukprot:COSAG04_NODE_918_length_9425_cov_1.980270_9_plen_344_part_00
MFAATRTATTWRALPLAASIARHASRCTTRARPAIWRPAGALAATAPTVAAPTSTAPPRAAAPRAGWCGWTGWTPERLAQATSSRAAPSLRLLGGLRAAREGRVIHRPSGRGFAKHAYQQHRKKACEQCDSTDSLEVHHVTPRSHGGTDDESNLMTFCHSCHRGDWSNVHWWGNTRQCNRNIRGDVPAVRHMSDVAGRPVPEVLELQRPWIALHNKSPMLGWEIAEMRNLGPDAKILPANSIFNASSRPTSIQPESQPILPPSALYNKFLAQPIYGLGKASVAKLAAEWPCLFHLHQEIESNPSKVEDVLGQTWDKVHHQIRDALLLMRDESAYFEEEVLALA